MNEQDQISRPRRRWGENVKNDLINIRTRDSVAGIATGYGIDDRGVGVRAPVGSRIFSTSSRPALGPNHPHRGLFPQG
jgi:hypothetical protein